jgi:vacuolar-type H+-ATPase catalytic subunit A/Vma1
MQCRSHDDAHHDMMLTELQLIRMLVLSCLVAVYEETAGLTVRDPVLRTHKVNNAKLY